MHAWLQGVVQSRCAWNQSPEQYAVAKFWKILEDKGMLEAGSMRLLKDAFRAAELRVAAVTILDFTPDNVFLTDTGFTFIDPWWQPTYTGNPREPWSIRYAC